ncbi:hypothetical protein CR513_11796, partial [Mucuna pruriens]
MHILNRSPTLTVKDKTSEQMWSKNKPKVDYFGVFGCLAHVHVPNQRKTKLDDKNLKCIPLGVSDESKAFRLFDPVARKIIVSKDVNFEEDKGWNWGRTTDEVKCDALNWKDNVEGEMSSESDEEDGEGAKTIKRQNQQLQHEVTHLMKLHAERRIRRAPNYLQDYEIGEGLLKDENNLAMFISCEDSNSFEEAERVEKWRGAMNLIGVKWIFRTKLNENGEVDKYNAYLVAKG